MFWRAYLWESLIGSDFPEQICLWFGSSPVTEYWLIIWKILSHAGFLFIIFVHLLHKTEYKYTRWNQNLDGLELDGTSTNNSLYNAQCFCFWKNTLLRHIRRILISFSSPIMNAIGKGNRTGWVPSLRK